MRERSLLTILIILAVVVFSMFVLLWPDSKVSKEVAECIGQNSELYVQLGCHACETQEKMFGRNYKYLNVIDCFYERNKCSGIATTPTWIIDGEQYKSVQSIERLKELTGC